MSTRPQFGTETAQDRHEPECTEFENFAESPVSWIGNSTVESGPEPQCFGTFMEPFGFEPLFGLVIAGSEKETKKGNCESR